MTSVSRQEWELETCLLNFHKFITSPKGVTPMDHKISLAIVQPDFVLSQSHQQNLTCVVLTGSCWDLAACCVLQGEETGEKGPFR